MNKTKLPYYILYVAILTLLIVGVGATIARAEGESVQIVSQDCQGIIVRGGGYTPNQTLLTFARAPQGEGTITNPVEVKANQDGMMPTTTLKFGGQVPDGTYQAVITTPGPGQKEEVVKEFQVRGCFAGERTVTATADCQQVTIIGNGFEQTEATVEAVVLGEGEMIKQVQPDAEGVFHTSIGWANPPQGGQRTVEVRIDSIKRAEANFQAPNCAGELPFTGVEDHLVLWLALAVILLTIGVLLLLSRHPRR